MSTPKPLLLLPLLLAMSACTTPDAANANPTLTALPVGSDWSLADADTPGLARPEASAIRLHIEADRISGDSGCNRFSAGYSLIEGKLEIGPALATKRACMDPMGEIEQQLFQLLPTLRSATMDGDLLVLHAADGSSLRFAATPPAKE